MTSSKLIALTTSTISRTQIKIAEIAEHKRFHKNKNKNYIPKRREEESYLEKVITRNSLVDGIPCAKCNGMIKPESYCWAKYKHNNRIGFPSYYCVPCWNRLYIE